MGPRLSDIEGGDWPSPKHEGLSFSDALAKLKTGRMLARKGWNGKGMRMHIYLHPESITTSGTKIRPYIMMKTVDGSFVPWVASQTDLLADDWLVVY